jgi:hypothetical protein
MLVKTDATVRGCNFAAGTAMSVCQERKTPGGAPNHVRFPVIVNHPPRGYQTPNARNHSSVLRHEVLVTLNLMTN